MPLVYATQPKGKLLTIPIGDIIEVAIFTNKEDTNMFCNNCGKEIPEGQNTCPACGAVANQSAAQPTPIQVVPVQTSNIPNDGMDYTPISMWGYFGYQILFAIPLIGFIMLLVFSFGGTRNINIRNYARSYFCFMILSFIVGIILSLLFGATFAAILSELS